MYWSRGVVFMLVAVFFFSTMNVFVKLLPHIPAIEIVFFRSLISLVISASILGYKKISLWGRNHKYLILRGASGMIALVLYFRLMQTIPLASAITILFLSPIFTNILGTFFLKEKVYPMQWIFYLISFAGILLVKGFDPRIEPIHLAIGISASIFSGLAHNFIRKMKTSEHPLVIIFYFPLVTMPFSGVISSFNWVNPVGWDWPVLLGIGILTQIAQYFMTRSYQAEELSKVVNIRYVSIIFAWAYGFFIFGESFTVLAYLGMVFTVAGVILNLWYRRKQIPNELPAN